MGANTMEFPIGKFAGGGGGGRCKYNGENNRFKMASLTLKRPITTSNGFSDTKFNRPDYPLNITLFGLI